eukprot:TRINITY_DN8277_c0_g1_i1.p1 TRINITY_DN8277_c0_g1~~TRINITY_DN8277_c0_g1_i1.p1  ORF type:complete len:366 (-),score=57.00 TRINITY_DN8277_c0_g1_i1:46-1143(-)
MSIDRSVVVEDLDFVLVGPESPDNCNESILSTFPNEILLNILYQLEHWEDIYSCQQTCTRWKYLAIDQNLWDSHYNFRGLNYFQAIDVLNKSNHKVAARMLAGKLFLTEPGVRLPVNLSTIVGAIITLHFYGMDSLAKRVFKDVESNLRKPEVDNHIKLSIIWWLVQYGYYSGCYRFLGDHDDSHSVHKKVGDMLYSELQIKQFSPEQRDAISMIGAECYLKYLKYQHQWDPKIEKVGDPSEDFLELLHNETKIIRKLVYFLQDSSGDDDVFSRLKTSARCVEVLVSIGINDSDYSTVLLQDILMSGEIFYEYLFCSGEQNNFFEHKGLSLAFLRKGQILARQMNYSEWEIEFDKMCTRLESLEP